MFGELEYVFGSIKMIFITMVILLMLILDTMKRESFTHCMVPLTDPLIARSNAYYSEPIGTQCKSKWK